MAGAVGMGAVWYCARSAVRRRIGATVVLAVLVGLAGATVLGAWAGARRTEAAFPRFLDAARAADVVVGEEALGPLDDEAIRRAPGVVAAGTVRGYGLAAVNARGEPDVDAGYGALVPDRSFLDAFIGGILLAGRLPDPDRADEVAVSADVVDETGLHVGDRIAGFAFAFNDLESHGEQRVAELAAEGREPTPADQAALFRQISEPVTATITGVLRLPDEIVVGENDDPEPILGVILTPAFAERTRIPPSYETVHVDLADPAGDLARFQQAVRAAHPDATLSFVARSDREAVVAVATQPYVQSLRIFTAVLALTALLVLGQALARQAAADGADGAALAALGLGPRAVAGVAMTRAALAGATGTVLAAVGAWLASSGFPVGPTRLAEPHPGRSADLLVLAAGGSVLLAATLAAAVVGARRAPGTGTGPGRRPSRLADRLARAGAPPPASVGVRFALESGAAGDGSLAAFLGVGGAVVALTAAAVFGAGLDRLVDEPARFGWRWDALFETYEGFIDQARAERLAGDDRISALALGARASATLAGVPVPAYGFDVRSGGIPLAVRAGSFPVAAGEVALGPRTLRRLGVGVGDTVDGLSAQGEPVRLRVVGEALFPALAPEATTALADGAAFTFAGLDALSGVEPSFALVDLAPGVALTEVAGAYDGDVFDVLRLRRPGEIVSYERVRRVPLLLAGFLALLGIGVLGHTLVTGVQRQRRTLAVLKTLGFVRRQVSATVAWHATAVATIALAVGVPLGVAAGRLAWRAFADDLGAGGPPVTPFVVLVGVVAGGYLLANLLSAGPAHRAGRIRPAVVLRSE